MSILYITSFSKDLYQATGREMVSSYLKSGIKETLLVTYEGFEFKNDDPRIASFDLNDSKYLQNWLKKNANIIPTYLGGNAKPSPETQVIFRDPWNRKASRWFRKIASFEYALNTFNKDQKYDYLVWIDCDSLILKKIEPQWLIEKAFRGGDIFYHLGEERAKKKTGIESGVIGFKKGKGYQVLRKVFQIYETGEFKQLKRWDDGYVFKFVIEGCIKLRMINGIDLATHANRISNEGGKMEVICKSIFRHHILHKKGLHKRMQISI